MARATTAASGDRSPTTGSSARRSSPTGLPTASAPSEPERRPSRARRRRATRLFRFDRELGCRYVAGADEAGRGSLAGPLVAAAVLFDLEGMSRSQRIALGGLDDSKRRTPAEREALLPAVLDAAQGVAIAVRGVGAIDRDGVHRANLEALARCLERVARPGCACLVDGFALGEPAVEHTPVVDGDARSAAIAAASVVAKVTRDGFMRSAGERHPQYGFELNAGYSTPEHRAAIQSHGPCSLHRLSFRSVAYTQLELG